MPVQSTEAWLAGASTPDRLKALVLARLRDAAQNGPALDSRASEAPEDVFEDKAREDAVFRVRLAEVVDSLLASTETEPDEAHAEVARGLLTLVERVPLTRSADAVLAWMVRHGDGLRPTRIGRLLGHAALGALAMAQPVASDTWRNQWLNWWQTGPKGWWPRVFIGLRRQSLDAAIAELPELVKRAGDKSGPLLLGLWQQSGAAAFLAAEVRQNRGSEWAEQTREFLASALDDALRRAWLADTEPVPGAPTAEDDVAALNLFQPGEFERLSAKAPRVAGRLVSALTVKKAA